MELIFHGVAGLVQNVKRESKMQQPFLISVFSKTIHIFFSNEEKFLMLLFVCCVLSLSSLLQ